MSHDDRTHRQRMVDLLVTLDIDRIHQAFEHGENPDLLEHILINGFTGYDNADEIELRDELESRGIENV